MDHAIGRFDIGKDHLRIIEEDFVAFHPDVDQFRL